MTKITDMTTEQRKEAMENARRLRQQKVAVFAAKTPKNASLVDGLSLSHASIYVDSLEGRLSAKKAIKAKCLECSAFQEIEVKHCTVTSCPLHPIRPYQLPAGGAV